MKFLLVLTLSLTALNAYAIDYVFKSGYGIVATWSVNDKIGIFARSDIQTRFDIQQIISSDSHSAKSYSTSGVSLNASSDYFSLSPYNYNYYLRDDISTALPVNFNTLTQSRNDDLSHIASSDLMAANVKTTTSQQAVFNYSHLGSILRLSVKTPETATFKGVKLESDKGKFLQTGTLNLEERKITTKTSSSAIELALNNISVSTNGQLTVYFIFSEVDMTGGALTATFATTSGKTYSCSFDARKYEAGKVYNVERTLHVGSGYNTARAASVSVADLPKAKIMRKASAVVTYPTCVISDFLLASSDISYDPEYIKGDANNDKKVNIADMATTISHVKGSTPVGFNKSAVDFNGDGVVNLTDVSYLSKMLLNK